MLIKKARVNILVDFCDKLEQWNLQPPVDIVHSQLGLLPLINAVNARDHLSLLLLREENPNLCQFLKDILSDEARKLARLSEDLRDEVRSLLGANYEASFQTIKKTVQDDSHMFQKDVDSWFATRLSGITFEKAPSISRRRILYSQLVDVMNKVASAHVHRNFYKQLEKHQVQPRLI